MSHPGEYPAQSLRRYLLGQLGEEDVERIDRQILAESEAVAALDSAEDDLIEDYLDGSLGDAERTAFEEHFLASPSHRQSLELARMIRARLQGEAAPAVPRRRAVGPWLGALAAALLIAVWFLLPPGEERPRVTDQGGPSSLPPVVPSLTGTPNASRPSPAPAPARVATIGLPVNNAMSSESEAHTLRVDAGVEQVRLDILLLDGHQAYRGLSARLEGHGGGLIYEWKSLAPKEIVPLTLPAQRLSAARYTLILVGREPDGAPGAELDRWEIVVDKR